MNIILNEMKKNSYIIMNDKKIQIKAQKLIKN